MNSLQETFVPLLLRDIASTRQTSIENRRQLCFSIVSFLTSNPKTLAKLMSTYQDDITLLAKNALAIEGDDNVALSPQTSPHNARRSKSCFVSFSSLVPRAPRR